MLLGMRSALLGSVPALNLPFALTGTLDPRITFSRPSLATMYDSTGRLVYAPNNLLLQSQTFNTASWSKFGSPNSVVTADATTAPDGTATADLVAQGSGGGYIGQSVTSIGGARNIFSCYVKAGTGATRAMLYIGGGGVGGSDGGVRFDLTTGAFVSTFGTAVTGYGFVDAGNGWWRFYVYFSTARNDPTFDCIVQFMDSTNSLVNISGYVWGAQAEAVTYQTTPSTYNATTSAAYYGPRFDYNPATLVARGLLIEEARTNIVLYSKTDVTNWVQNNVVGTIDSIAAPDGTASATLITANGGANNFLYSATPHNTTAAPWTQSFYVKAGTASWIYIRAADNTSDTWFNVSTGVVGTLGAGCTSTITAVGNGWYRCTVTKTTSASASGFAVVGIANGDNSTTAVAGQTIYVWGAQTELGSFATSYIPTAASAVARSADSASMTGTNFSSWYNQTQGTFVVNSNIEGRAAAASYVFAASDGSANEIVGGFVTTTSHRIGFVVDGGVTQVDLNAGATLVNTDYKIAFAYKLNDFAASLNGASPLTDTVGTIPTPSEMGIGSRGGSSFFNGWIASIAYYNTHLPNVQLQSLTT